MRSDSSAARAGHSDARVTRPWRFGLAVGSKNRNRSGRLAVGGIFVTSAGKAARGAMGALPVGAGGAGAWALAAPGVAATMPAGRAAEATIQPRTRRLETPPDAGRSGLGME